MSFSMSLPSPSLGPSTSSRDTTAVIIAHDPDRAQARPAAPEEYVGRDAHRRRVGTGGRQLDPMGSHTGARRVLVLPGRLLRPRPSPTGAPNDRDRVRGGARHPRLGGSRASGRGGRHCPRTRACCARGRRGRHVCARDQRGTSVRRPMLRRGGRLQLTPGRRRHGRHRVRGGARPRPRRTLLRVRRAPGDGSRPLRR